jgi:hypothetical protein
VTNLALTGWGCYNQGAFLAASLASQLKLSHFVIEGDSLIVISALLFPAIISDWHIEHLIHDTLALLSPTSMWKAKKINRSANFCAHHVATWAAARVYSSCIPTFPPFPSPSSFGSGIGPLDVFFPPLKGCKVLLCLMQCLLPKKKKNQPYTNKTSNSSRTYTYTTINYTPSKFDRNNGVFLEPKQHMYPFCGETVVQI